MYNPKFGIWLQRDPILDGMNPYQYVNDRPVNATDPFGLSEKERAYWSMIAGKLRSNIAGIRQQYEQDYRAYLLAKADDKSAPPNAPRAEPVRPDLTAMREAIGQLDTQADCLTQLIDADKEASDLWVEGQSEQSGAQQKAWGEALRLRKIVAGYGIDAGLPLSDDEKIRAFFENTETRDSRWSSDTGPTTIGPLGSRSKGLLTDVDVVIDRPVWPTMRDCVIRVVTGHSSTEDFSTGRNGPGGDMPEGDIHPGQARDEMINRPGEKSRYTRGRLEIEENRRATNESKMSAGLTALQCVVAVADELTTVRKIRFIGWHNTATNTSGFYISEYWKPDATGAYSWREFGLDSPNGGEKRKERAKGVALLSDWLKVDISNRI